MSLLCWLSKTTSFLFISMLSCFNGLLITVLLQSTSSRLNSFYLHRSSQCVWERLNLYTSSVASSPKRTPRYASSGIATANCSRPDTVTATSSIWALCLWTSSTFTPKTPAIMSVKPSTTTERTLPRLRYLARVGFLSLQ